jgi:hypothetical protein
LKFRLTHVLLGECQTKTRSALLVEVVVLVVFVLHFVVTLFVDVAVLVVVALLDLPVVVVNAAVAVLVLLVVTVLVLLIVAVVRAREGNRCITTRGAVEICSFGGAGDAKSLDSVDEVGAGSLDSSSEVRDIDVGLQDRAYGVLLLHLLGIQRARVSMVTSTRVGGSAAVEVHPMSAAVSPLVAMEATTLAEEIATCIAIATIVRRPPTWLNFLLRSTRRQD